MSELDVPADLDSQGHRPSCPRYGKAETAQAADETGVPVDRFCECHDWAEPLVLGNGVDVAWPAGWDTLMATEWREKHVYSGGSAAGPHETPELTNSTSTAGTGMLPKVGNPSDEDMAPGG
jgi:hypothetical protein